MLFSLVADFCYIMMLFIFLNEKWFYIMTAYEDKTIICNKKRQKKKKLLKKIFPPVSQARLKPSPRLKCKSELFQLK